MESRSFWKAGAYDFGSSPFGFTQDELLEYARVHPKFLHSNATSHKWAFGAIAELLDNAVDEISSGATFIKVDKIKNTRDNSSALLFQDDGGGMDPECIRKCMSLGYSSKKSNNTAIGQYGNGFKTSTMRLGADVIVYSCTTHGSYSTQSIGLLSYTFLRKTGQNDVIVPMVDFELSEHQARPIIYSSQDDWFSNLKVILEWSPFASEEELLLQFEDIGPHGTKVIVYNLWSDDNGLPELDFETDEEDIKLKNDTEQGMPSKALVLTSHISYRIRYSLRAYASILYLRKFSNFCIILRGKPVEHYNIAADLRFSTIITYRPQLGPSSKEASVETTIGFVEETHRGVSGLCIYHKNRLIRPFWKFVTDGSSRGMSVVGVLEANFIEPAHDKQDFERSFLSIRLETKLKQMAMDYWTSHGHLVGIHHLNNAPRDNVHKIAPKQQRVSTAQPVIVVPASTNRREFPTSQPTIVQENGCFDGVSSVQSSKSILVDQLKEENLKLFIRAEEHRQREMDLRRTIEDMERKIGETKRQCSQLASHVEMQRKQTPVKKPY